MLKITYLLIAVGLLFTTNLLAQYKFKVVEQTAAMSKGSQNCLTMELMGSDIKTVTKSWGKFIKKYKGKTKFDKNTGETFSDNATVTGMSDNTVDIYAVATPKGDVSQIAVWFNLGVTYLSSKEHSDRYPTAEKMIIDFGYYVSADLIAIELKLTEKQLKTEQKELKKIEKVRAGFEKKIEKQKAIIAKAETEIGVQKGEIEKNNEVENAKMDEIKATGVKIEEFKQMLIETKQRLSAK